MSDDLGAPAWRAFGSLRGPGSAAVAGWLGRRGLARLRRPLREVVRTLRQGRLNWRTAAEPLPAPEPAIESGAAFLEFTHTEAAGARRYRLYRPASLAGAAPRGLVMMLHGCGQTPEDFATGTGMNRLAETHRLIVVYPGQARADNAKGCWNWFRPGDQARGSGEPAILAGLARAVAAEHGVPADRVFVAGLSAGGSMAAVLGATYPDVFAAVGVHSGLPNGSANDAISALAAMRGDHGPGPGPDGVPVPLIVFHGDADSVVHPLNGERLAAAGRESGAPRARRGTAGGRGFSRWVDRGRDGAPALEYWVVEGGGHAWSGGDPVGSYADPAGPDASAEMVRFFLGNAR
jgi:poly(hydroxyalkanoate) depolymerase family esterase